MRDDEASLHELLKADAGARAATAARMPNDGGGGKAKVKAEVGYTDIFTVCCAGCLQRSQFPPSLT